MQRKRYEENSACAELPSSNRARRRRCVQSGRCVRTEDRNTTIGNEIEYSYEKRVDTRWIQSAHTFILTAGNTFNSRPCQSRDGIRNSKLKDELNSLRSIVTVYTQLSSRLSVASASGATRYFIVFSFAYSCFYTLSTPSNSSSSSSSSSSLHTLFRSSILTITHSLPLSGFISSLSLLVRYICLPALHLQKYRQNLAVAVGTCRLHQAKSSSRAPTTTTTTTTDVSKIETHVCQSEGEGEKQRRKGAGAITRIPHRLEPSARRFAGCTA